MTTNNNSTKTLDNTSMKTAMEAALKEAGMTSGASIDVKKFAPMITQNLSTILAVAEELNESAQADLTLMTEYSKVVDLWNDLLRRVNAARIAYDSVTQPLIRQLKDAQEKAKKFENWLTFERSEEISAMIFTLNNRDTFLKAIPELEAERVALLPQYEEAREFLAQNELRKQARKVTK